ncbi:hypothetical protein CHU98_g4754 [Xylaria longipes]|nr:hypothetical protein CHU98_g4754 [Xylaria longipes]
MASAANTRRDYENEVRSWGFSNVFTWTDPPHNGLTTHLIVDGQLTITYPKDASPSKITYSAGDRIDVDARRVHEVWVGPQGCTMVIATPDIKTGVLELAFFHRGNANADFISNLQEENPPVSHKVLKMIKWRTLSAYTASGYEQQAQKATASTLSSEKRLRATLPTSSSMSNISIDRFTDEDPTSATAATFVANEHRPKSEERLCGRRVLGCEGWRQGRAQGDRFRVRKRQIQDDSLRCAMGAGQHRGSANLIARPQNTAIASRTSNLRDLTMQVTKPMRTVACSQRCVHRQPIRAINNTSLASRLGVD